MFMKGYRKTSISSELNHALKTAKLNTFSSLVWSRIDSAQRSEILKSTLYKLFGTNLYTNEPKPTHVKKCTQLV
jgi:hypothetical protein